MTDKEFKEQINHKPFKSLDAYTYGYTKIRFKCKLDGYVWRATPLDAKRMGCPWCDGRHKKNVRQEWKDLNKRLFRPSKPPKPAAPDHMTTGEHEVSIWLDSHGISYVTQKSYEDCRDKLPLPFDFYLPELNTCIEYDGIQHFEPIPFFGGEEGFRIRQLHDKIKTEYCKENNIQLIRVPYTDAVDVILMESIKAV